MESIAATPAPARGTPREPAGGAVDISVVLPVFNEIEHLDTELDRIRAGLEASPYSYEIIVVDDGSSDGSTEKLRARDDIRLIEFADNHGSGTARRVGTAAARGEVVVWSDVDMTYPNHQIVRLVEALRGSDQVVGARDAERGTHRLARVPAKWFIRRLASYLAQREIPDLNSGFRAFRRDVAVQFLDQLPKGFSCVTTISMSFLANGYSITYVPIEYGERSGRSKFHWWHDTKRYVTQVVSLAMSYAPLRVFMPLGLALLATGTGKLVFDWVTRDFRLTTNTLLLLVAAFQTIALGLVADLVVRVSKPRGLVAPAGAGADPLHLPR
jgi:glycosyltransferase involved in cell wall biosynthesis